MGYVLLVLLEYIDPKAFHLFDTFHDNMILSRNIAAHWESPWRHVLIFDNKPGFVEQLDLPSLASFANSQLIFDW